MKTDPSTLCSGPPVFAKIWQEFGARNRSPTGAQVQALELDTVDFFTMILLLEVMMAMPFYWPLGRPRDFNL
jgi:hypothetical protein